MLEAAIKVDEICDSYEKALRRGKPVNKAIFLMQIEADLQPMLQVELDAIEAELRPDYPLTPENEVTVSESAGNISASEETRIPPPAPADTAAFPKKTPKLIGPYRVLKEIGEGGMGTVFLAEQEFPVRRLVALKLIRPHLNSPEVLTRFEIERQTLAMMDHPNIARILDAGTSEDGHAYFAMEFVKGIPLVEFCDSKRLSLSERLDLFVQVCDAVQHAHQKGIIHRDLKPSNILVTKYDDELVVKVIDFGLAKALETTNQLTDQTQFTRMGQIIGTLSYMSPEQAGLGAADVDTRADVYSLGAVLYELLTGSTPLLKGQVCEQPLLEVLQLVRESEATRPAARLAEYDRYQLMQLCLKRQTDSKRLKKVLADDLEWIVLKALEKDRNRRYETANSFAADVKRYMAGEPISARSPTVSYRLQKFVGRNRGIVTSAAIILMLLCSFTALSAAFAYRASRLADSEKILRAIAEQKTEQLSQQAEQLSQQTAKAQESEERAQLKAAQAANALAVVVDAFEVVKDLDDDASERSAKIVLLRARNLLADASLDDETKTSLLDTLTACFLSIQEFALAAETGDQALTSNLSLYGDRDARVFDARLNVTLARMKSGDLELARESLTQVEQHADSLTNHQRRRYEAIADELQQSESLNVKSSQ